MSEPVVGGKGKRTYRSTRREAQARRTRQRIIAAATEQFLARGYAGTTIRAVAAAAGVSIPTVELGFGTKAQLLKAAIDVAIAGDDEPVSMLERDWAAGAQRTTDAGEFLAVVGQTLRPAAVRSAGLVVAAFEALHVDTAIQAVVVQLRHQRSVTVTWIVDGLTERAPLRPTVNRQTAIDTVWLLIDPVVYQRLTRDRGWSNEQYQAWIIDSIQRLLLDTPTATPPELQPTARRGLDSMIDDPFKLPSNRTG
jgi:AcrR family transcriptional regulator